MVLQAASGRLHLSRGQFLLIERELLVRRRQADVIRNPYAMLADIEVADLTSSRRGHVGVAGLVERHRSRIGDIEVAGPSERLRFRADADAGQGKQGKGERAHGVQPTRMR